MLLRQKKTQGEDQNWCIILSPIQSEIDKKKVAQKLTGVFSLSSEEAFDLVANTPIILLDNLTHPIATKLKDYFRAAGAETVLTNDVFQKRKCYRTVWPEPPSLSFLHDWNPLNNDSSSSRHVEMPPSEALDEVRTMAREEREEKNLPKPSLSSIPFLSRTERDQLTEELEIRRQDNLTLREEVKRLKEQLEKNQKENLLHLGNENEHEEEGEWSEDKDNEIKEARMLLDHANEKYEVLRQEYANARHLYEEKIAGFLQESEPAKRKVQELGDSLKVYQKERQHYEERLSQKDHELQALTAENQKLKLGYEQKLSKESDEIARLHMQLRDLLEKVEILQKTKDQLELTINAQAEQITYWHDKHDTALPKILLLEKKFEEERDLREKIEMRQKDSEKSQLRLIQEMEEKGRLVREWEMKCLDRDKQYAEMKETYHNQERILESNFRQLESRERELESVRRQLHEVSAQLEEREAIQKQALLSNQLVEKESVLKQLVREQQKMELEIKEREESIRNLLSQQEAVEKDIIEAKQTQRHWSVKINRATEGFQNSSDSAERTSGS